MLGICYGMQLICQALGGRVQSHPVREYGRAHCTIDEGSDADILFAGVPRETEVWMSHGDQVDTRLRRLHAAGAARHPARIAAVKHRDAAALRPAVPSRSHAHARRQDDPRQFPDERLRLHRHLAAGRFRRANDRAACASESARIA